MPLHDNDGPRLSCRHLVRHPAFFLSPLMSSPPRHPILGRPAQWLLHVHEGVSQHARTIIFAVVGRPIRFPGLHLLVLPPQPAATAHSRSHEPIDACRRGYKASRSCS
jgi:hypothetical protein